jgi:hypothetical protein
MTVRTKDPPSFPTPLCQYFAPSRVQHIFKAIGESLSVELSRDTPPLEGKQFQCVDLISQVVPQPKQQRFFLMGQDCTSIGRPLAKSLEDRGMVHQPTQIKSNKPITIGHSYSLLAILPERNNEDAPWTIPLDMSRVPKAIAIGCNTLRINAVTHRSSVK